MKILFLVPDGVGIRNYLYSSLLRELAKQGCEIIIWHALSENAMAEVKSLHNIKIHTEKLPYYKESIFEKFLRESICYARLRHNTQLTNNPTIMTNWTPPIKNLTFKTFYKAVEISGMMLGSYDSITKMEIKYQDTVKKSHHLETFSNFLERHKPDLIFNTHQRAIIAIPAITAAEKLGIRTVSAIYSWDNLPKARLATRAESFLVWSEYMKNEMKIYYPEIREDQVVVTGTPQFEFYSDKSLYWTKEEFCQKIGLDLGKKIICFSGDDTRTSPYDSDYLADLAEAVMQVESSERPQILFRRSPADFSDRYDDVLERYQEIIKISDPLWSYDTEENCWNFFYPAFDDIKLLVNITYHCDTVYNVGSTMAHDFAKLDKPAIYINYNQAHAKDWSVETIYGFQHFKSMDGLDAVVWVNNKDEIKDAIKKVLETPEMCSVDRKKWLEAVVGQSTDVSKNIANYFIKL